jgi:hypothetical protein
MIVTGETLYGPFLDLSLLDETGVLRLLHAAEYDEMPRSSLRVWCHRHGRYGLPTVELVEWLSAKIGDRKAIEIGAGSGDLAFHLGIPATDSRNQEWPDVAAYYALMGQPLIRYPAWVQTFDAVQAVAHYLPRVVIGSWITQWCVSNAPAQTKGSIYGVQEDVLLSSGVEYILIGNLAVHGDKKIMNLPHQEFDPGFLRSRASQPELDRIFIWNANTL